MFEAKSCLHREEGRKCVQYPQTLDRHPVWSIKHFAANNKKYWPISSHNCTVAARSTYPAPVSTQLNPSSFPAQPALADVSSCEMGKIWNRECSECYGSMTFWFGSGSANPYPMVFFILLLVNGSIRIRIWISTYYYGSGYVSYKTYESYGSVSGTLEKGLMVFCRH